jgi:transketolase
MRKQFADYLYKLMKENENIYLLLGDLGYGYFDKHLADFPKRTINCGASEQAMIGMAIGLAQEGKIPFVYSITNFLIYRPFEIIRNYINHEKTKVVLVGSGRDFDYEHDGWSHHSPDVKEILEVSFPNIKTYFPKSEKDIKKLVDEIIEEPNPAFISLKR